MPYQSLASLGVIIAMFNVVPLLNSGVQALAYGVRRCDVKYRSIVSTWIVGIGLGENDLD